MTRRYSISATDAAQVPAHLIEGAIYFPLVWWTFWLSAFDVI
jgi:hypothetical protein